MASARSGLHRSFLAEASPMADSTFERHRTRHRAPLCPYQSTGHTFFVQIFHCDGKPLFWKEVDFRGQVPLDTPGQRGGCIHGQFRGRLGTRRFTGPSSGGEECHECFVRGRLGWGVRRRPGFGSGPGEASSRVPEASFWRRPVRHVLGRDLTSLRQAGTASHRPRCRWPYPGADPSSCRGSRDWSGRIQAQAGKGRAR